MQGPFQSEKSQNGSALLVAVIFTTILAAIIIPSYLKLSNSLLRLSIHNYYNTAALNLAESGIEHALVAINEASQGSNPWGNWYATGDDVRITYDQFDYAGSITGSVNVYIVDFQGEGPEIISKATIEVPGGETVEKYMYATLSATTRPGLFAYGMLTRDFIQASGGAKFDSWVSDPDNDDSTPYVPYSNAVARDNASVASASTATPSITLGSSDVYGTASIGADSYSGLSVGWGGQVGPSDPEEWDPEDTEELWKKNGWLVSTQTGALTTGFTAEFEEISPPEDLLGLLPLQPSYTLPYTDQVLFSNQWSSWYQNVYVDEETIGSPGEDTVKHLDSLTVKAGATLTVAGNVTVVLPKENTDVLKVIEGGKIVLQNDANLVVYSAGNIVISGAGLMNQVAPKQLQIWGTSSSNQKIKFQGSGQMSGIVYAPNADLTLPGGTNLYGSVVANSVSMSGSGSFHYDESLRNLGASSGSGGPVGVQIVKELDTPEERAPYVSKLSF